jgi:hypothetical protein
MRSYFNGGGSTSSATPPPSLSGRTRGSTGQMLGVRSSSASLPRSPESDLAAMMNVGGSSGSGHGSLGSHDSNQEVYVNIYQNTNHPSLFESNAEGSPRHSLGSNNSSNLSSPPSPAREHASSSYES